MGTSTVHRSPHTPRWRVVNNLYDNAAVKSPRLLAELLNAAADPYRAGLADVDVSRRLSVLLELAASGPVKPTQEAVMTLAREFSARTQQSSDVTGTFFGALANRAAHATFLSTRKDPRILSSREATVQDFLSNLFSVCVDHLFSRDASAHLGSERLPKASSVLKLRNELLSNATAISSSAELTRAITAAAESPAKNWARLISDAWALGAARRGKQEREGSE